MLTPGKKRNEVNSESIPSGQVPWQDGQAKSYNAEFSIAGNSPNEPSGRFVPPQSNNTNSSSHDTDSLNTTMVYYEKSTGECQTKTTSIQTSPRDPGSTGTTTATQTTNKNTSQVEGTQTMPPPPPRKSTSMEETQTSPPAGSSCQQVAQGQPDHNQDREGQLTNITSGKGKKSKKSTSKAPSHPGPSTGPSVGPRNDFTSRNLGTGRPTIQCTACGEYSH